MAYTKEQAAKWNAKYRAKVKAQVDAGTYDPAAHGRAAAARSGCTCELCTRYRKDCWLKTKYGTDIDTYEKLIEEQSGKCAICQQKPDYSLSVDHDHITGKIRGLLCKRCNTGIGQFNDDLVVMQNAANYLTHHRL